MDAAPVLVWVSDVEGACTWFNRHWTQFVGRSLAEELGRGWLDNIHPDDRDGCLAAERAAFAAARQLRREYRLRHHDGSWRWILDQGAPFTSADGSIGGYLGSCIDITESRASAAAVEESHQRYQTLSESLPHLVWTCNADGWCDYLGKQWVEYTGRPEEEQRGYGWAEQLHPDDRDRARAAWAQATAGGDRYEIEFRIRRADGVYRWFKTRAVPLHDASGRIVKWFGSNTDFEDHKRTEQRLNSQIERLELLDRITRAISDRQDLNSIFRAVLSRLEESLPIDFGCVCLADDAALTVAAIGPRSQALAETAGLSERARVRLDPECLALTRERRLVHEADLPNAALPFAKQLAAAGLRSLVLAPLVAEGNVSGALIAARAGDADFDSADCEFLRQLSEHVALAARQAQLQRALQHAYDDLRQSQATSLQHERLRALGQMAAGIAHNINNAVSPVSLYTELLLAEEELSPTARDYLETIQRSIADVALTVAGMRDFYRQPNAFLPLTLVDLNEVVRQVIDLTRARWSDMPLERGVVIQVKTELAEPAPQIQAVGAEIREALINLIFNAVDAMPQGGTLTLKTAWGALPSRSSNAAPSEEVWLQVSDDGVGMSEEVRRRCFDPFMTTKGERGTGLGLALVYGVVQRHNAAIEIESAPDSGTTVRIKLAAAEKATDASSATMTTAPAPLDILLIDDDPLLIRSLRDVLVNDGHRVRTADSGAAGIEAFRVALQEGTAFSVVLTDLGMPHIDGNEVARAIKACSPTTPVILITGWGHRVLADPLPPHVDLVLGKPPRLFELRKALALVCAPPSRDASPRPRPS